MRTKSELELLRRDLMELETKAGIREQVADAALVSSNPLGVFGGGTPDEYDADADRHLRRRLRKLYFSVQDHDLRLQLIAKACDIGREGNEIERDDTALAVSTARNEFQKATKRKTSTWPWVSAGIVGAISVAMGNVLFGIPGAIAGAVFAYFWGEGHIVLCTTERQFLLNTAEEQLDDAIEQSKKCYRTEKAMFSAAELLSGREDDREA